MTFCSNCWLNVLPEGEPAAKVSHLLGMKAHRSGQLVSGVLTRELPGTRSLMCHAKASCSLKVTASDLDWIVASMVDISLKGGL